MALYVFCRVQVNVNNANLPVNLDIVSLTQISITEGERAYVNSENIAIVLDIAKYGMDDNCVGFTLISPPLHGSLNQEIQQVERNRSFTLRDVNQEKVRSLKGFEMLVQPSANITPLSFIRIYINDRFIVIATHAITYTEI